VRRGLHGIQRLGGRDRGVELLGRADVITYLLIRFRAHLQRSHESANLARHLSFAQSGHRGSATLLVRDAVARGINMAVEIG
jgi:hypothetical protein